MRDCWLADPGTRPSFTEISEKIGDEIINGNKEVRISIAIQFNLTNV